METVTSMSCDLSLCMVVKNEEANLPRCLDSVRALRPELIVVDTGSSDATRNIAADYGAVVIPFDFRRVDFAAARNCAIEHAGSPWILVLDADERLAPSGPAGIEALTALGGNLGYYLARFNQTEAPARPFTDYVVRLFPKAPYFRYQGRVHETVDASILAGGGELRKSAVRIEHAFCPDREMRRRKNQRYIEILKEEIAANPGDCSRLDFLAAEYHQLEMFHEAAAVAECIVAMRPLDPSAHLFAGVYHLTYLCDPVRARADLQEALKLRPDYHEAKCFLQLIEGRQSTTGSGLDPQLDLHLPVAQLRGAQPSPCSFAAPYRPLNEAVRP